MDPITFISLIYKITMFSPQKNSNEDERKLNQKSRAEIIELYRSTMTNDNKLRKKLTNPNSPFHTLFHVILEQNLKIADLEALKKGIRIQNKVHNLKSIAFIQGGTKKEIGIEANNLSPSLLKKILSQR